MTLKSSSSNQGIRSEVCTHWSKLACYPTEEALLYGCSGSNGSQLEFERQAETKTWGPERGRLRRQPGLWWHCLQFKSFWLWEISIRGTCHCFKDLYKSRQEIVHVCESWKLPNQCPVSKWIHHSPHMVSVHHNRKGMKELGREVDVQSSNKCSILHKRRPWWKETSISPREG